MLEAPGLVTSTNPVPLERPISAYSRPDGLTYPQTSLPLVFEESNVLQGNQLINRIPLD